MKIHIEAGDAMANLERLREVKEFLVILAVKVIAECV